MRVPDRCLADLRQRGYLVFEGFLEAGELAAAQQALWRHYPRRASPRERSLFGFPAPGDPYWDEQTLADTQTRYPRADLTPYR